MTAPRRMAPTPPYVRPAGCCGVCPPIVGGGYDCTCRGNPRCSTYTDIVRMAHPPTETIRNLYKEALG